MTNYVRELNALCEGMLRDHGDILERKNVHRKQELIRIIKLDLDKIAHALVEVRDGDADVVVRAFFDGTPPLEGLAAITGRLRGGRIDHVGFEVHEPLDLVIEGIAHWIEDGKRTLGDRMKIASARRFPASAAFQQRVGAYAEIMRITLQVDDRSLMLELFDIHRPVDAALAAAPASTHRNFHDLARAGSPKPGHELRLERLFSDDTIWHWAFFVPRADDVAALHEACRTLAARNPDFLIPYSTPVHNPHDATLHTKIIRRAAGAQARKEFEFVTHYHSAPPPAGV